MPFRQKSVVDKRSAFDDNLYCFGDSVDKVSPNYFSIVETPITKAKRNGIGKLNNPAKRRVYIRDPMKKFLFKSGKRL
jgi:hypothetical protein